MTRLIFCVLIALAFIAPSVVLATGEGQQELEKVTLQPNESKEVVVETKEKINIGWNHVKSDGDKNCKNNCIELKDPASDRSFASLMGGSMGMEPKSGKVTVMLKNIEEVPLEIAIYKKPATN